MASGAGCARAYALGIVFILGLFFVSSELIRNQGAEVFPFIPYYRNPGWVLAPYNIWCRSRTEGGDCQFPSKEVHFPRHGVLEENWEAIRGEALALYERGKAGLIKGDQFFTRIADDGWRRFYLRWYGPIQSDARELCPVTSALLDNLPEVRLAMFSFLAPGSKIIPHTGPSKGAKRYHLGLSCPPEAQIIVDGEAYSWKDGEGVLFDDTYVHSVENRSAKAPRVVLFCDVDTKLEGRLANTLNRHLLSWLAPLTTRTNDATEKKAGRG
jgi:beta-hydroxylase